MKPKKTMIALLILALAAFAAHAEAPELKNIMPNSWKKLTRLPAAEERAFVSQGGAGNPWTTSRENLTGKIPLIFASTARRYAASIFTVF